MDIKNIIENAEYQLRRGMPQISQGLIEGILESVDERDRTELYDLLGRIYLALGRQYFEKAHGEPTNGASSASAIYLLPSKEAEPEPYSVQNEFDLSQGALEDMRLRLVLDSLAEHKWVQSAAADHLGMSKFRIHRILRKHGLLDAIRFRREKNGA